jgi:Flp pilus assembly secretin CpaC
MTAFVACRGRRPLLFSALVVLAAVASPISALADDPVQGRLREPVTVHVDQATLLKLPDRTATLVIGNPLIADAVVQDGALVITAKSYGMTNLVVLDKGGTMLSEYPIRVVAPSDHVVAVYRGVERESYSCSPTCERRIMLGDSPIYLTQTLTTYGAWANSASTARK